MLIAGISCRSQELYCGVRLLSRETEGSVHEPGMYHAFMCLLIFSIILADPYPYPFQLNMKINYTFSIKFQCTYVLSKISYILTPMTMTQIFRFSNLCKSWGRIQIQIQIQNGTKWKRVFLSIKYIKERTVNSYLPR